MFEVGSMGSKSSGNISRLRRQALVEITAGGPVVLANWARAIDIEKCELSAQSLLAIIK